jgi:hypothetical protein
MVIRSFPLNNQVDDFHGFPAAQSIFPKRISSVLSTTYAPPGFCEEAQAVSGDGSEVEQTDPEPQQQ